MSDLTRASCCGRALILSAPTRASKILCTVLAYPGEAKSAKNQFREGGVDIGVLCYDFRPRGMSAHGFPLSIRKCEAWDLCCTADIRFIPERQSKYMVDYF